MADLQAIYAGMKTGHLLGLREAFLRDLDAMKSDAAFVFIAGRIAAIDAELTTRAAAPRPRPPAAGA